MNNSLFQGLSGQSIPLTDMGQSLEQSELNSITNGDFYGDGENLKNTKLSIIDIEMEKSSLSSFKMGNLQIIKEKNFYRPIYCKKCNTVCSVFILGYGTLNIDCDCTKLQNMSVFEFKNVYLHGDKNEKENGNKESNIVKKEKNFKITCLKHPEHKYIYYCTDCCQDICEEYLKENNELYSNTEKKK